MEGIVLELERDLLSDNCNILNALRKAKVIASKLNLTEFGYWIDKELNGYSTEKEVPGYRVVQGILRARNPYAGWIPAIIQNGEIEQALCKRGITSPISELFDYCKDDATQSMGFYFNGSLQGKLNDMFENQLITMDFAVMISNSTVRAVVESVKNYLLDKILELDAKGIRGEGLSFSTEEKSAARELSPSVINNYGQANFLTAPVENAQLVSGNDNNIKIDQSIGKEITTEVKEAIKKEQLSEQDMEKALNLLSEINEKIEQKEKPSKIKAAWKVLKDFLIGAGANVAAALIQSKIIGI